MSLNGKRKGEKQNMPDVRKRERARRECETPTREKENESEMLRDEGVGRRQGHEEELSCREMERRKQEDRSSHQALISPLGSVSLGFKTRRTLVFEILSLLQLCTAAKTKVRRRDNIHK